MIISRGEIKKFLSIALILIPIFYFFFYVSKKFHEKVNVEESSTSDILVENMSFLKPFELQSEGYVIPPKFKVIDEAGKEMSFHDLFKENSSLLIYRFSETHCDICIEQHISILKDLNTIINPDKLILLSSYSNLKKVKIVRQTHNLNFRIYNTMDDLGIPLERTSTPYFFIMDKDLKCNSFFSAIKENPDLTISCIQILSKKL